MHTKKLAALMGMVCGFAAANANAVTMTFFNNSAATDAVAYTVAATGCASAYSAGFGANTEFRLIGPSDAGCTVGGAEGEMDIYSTAAGQTWIFDGDAVAGGSMTGVTGFPNNPGISLDVSLDGSAAPLANTNPTLNQDALFFGVPFNFLAPTTTSLAGAAYGAATLRYGAGDNFSIHFNVMEFQWAGYWLPLGISSAGIDFRCTGATTGNFTCIAEHLITYYEDLNAAGFGGWVAQWRIAGTLDELHPVPIPAAAWLLGSGLLGLVPLARRKKKEAPQSLSQQR